MSSYYRSALSKTEISSTTSDAEVRSRDTYSKIKKEPSYDLPRSVLRHSDHILECRKLANLVIREGWNCKAPPSFNKELIRWFNLLRTSLDFWDRIPIEKALDKKTILVSCLREGPVFAEWLKKTRAYSLQNKIAIGTHNAPDEYVLEEYCGYDSLFHESNLIHWEEKTSDADFMFLPLRHISEETKKAFREEFSERLKEFGPSELKIQGTHKLLRMLKASQTYNPQRGKNEPMRETLPFLKKIEKGWWGKRAIVQAMPGGIRDTAIAEPGTIVKIRSMSEIFKQICQTNPNSAMADHLSQKRRISRLDKKRYFHHIDMKKIGLTLPRIWIRIMAEEIEKLYGVNLDFIKEFEKELYYEKEGTTHKPKRGYLLGWANEAVTLVLDTILSLLRKKHSMNFDYLVFNDDIEVGDSDDDPENQSMLFKIATLEHFTSFDIYLSMKKVFSSYERIFLEDYRESKSTTIDLQKRQLGTNLFAKSKCCGVPWLAKMYSNAAYELYQEISFFEEIQRTIGQEWSNRDDTNYPYGAGGWFTFLDQGMDDSLESGNVDLFIALSEIDISEKTTKWKKTFDSKIASEIISRKEFSATEFYSNESEPMEEVKDNTYSDWKEILENKLSNYVGRNEILANNMHSLLERVEQHSGEEKETSLALGIG